MKEQPKKILSITLALLLGTGIILFAWKGGSVFNLGDSTQKTNEGTRDALQVVSRGTSPKTLGARNIYGNPVGSAPTEGSATTTTDALARNFLVDYALTQKGMETTVWSDADADALAKKLIEKIELPKAVQYTTKDLNILDNNSDAALVTYGEGILKILSPLSASKNAGMGEVTIFGEAINNKDAKGLEGLTPIIAKYAEIKESLLALKAPSSIAPIHLHFVQNFANIENDVTSMQKIFSDPAQALAGFIEYKKDVAALSATGKEFQNYRPAQ
ncbi:MAG: hypothetical protein A2481_03830 [Candidatus Yonathbacteria bacterium RIFOXYC2_FULL_47_9]|nr:MAG: hypothetical protein A2481_03830 [Candidatus Yonathbacteria bacterium RIFOXYC2_FULL_47_9]HAT68245.1 hypothetical protein [Candidatus Yonathbacteria bacterium]